MPLEASQKTGSVGTLDLNGVARSAVMQSEVNQHAATTSTHDVIVQLRCGADDWGAATNQALSLPRPRGFEADTPGGLHLVAAAPQAFVEPLVCCRGSLECRYFW